MVTLSPDYSILYTYTNLRPTNPYLSLSRRCNRSATLATSVQKICRHQPAVFQQSKSNRRESSPIQGQREGLRNRGMGKKKRRDRKSIGRSRIASADARDTNTTDVAPNARVCVGLLCKLRSSPLLSFSLFLSPIRDVTAAPTTASTLPRPPNPLVVRIESGRGRYTPTHPPSRGELAFYFFPLS